VQESRVCLIYLPYMTIATDHKEMPSQTHDRRAEFPADSSEV